MFSSRHRQRLGPVAAIAATFVAGLAIGAVVSPISGRSATAPSAAPVAETEAEPSPLGRGQHLVTVLRVNDGDTFEARVHVWPGLDITTKIRLRGIDTPEMKARCQDEFARAQAARDALVRMLAEGDVTVRRVSLDKYGGRMLAEVATRTRNDVGTALISGGHARPYDGGRRPPWCDGP